MSLGHLPIERVDESALHPLLTDGGFTAARLHESCPAGPGGTVESPGVAGRPRVVMMMPMQELVFEVTQEADGGYVAEALGESIITQADTWEELRSNVREAVRAFYFDRPAPERLRLHLVRDEVLA